MSDDYKSGEHSNSPSAAADSWADWAESGIQEILNGAISPTDKPNLFKIQANTANGLRNFDAIDTSEEDIQSQEDCVVKISGIPQRKATKIFTYGKYIKINKWKVSPRKFTYKGIVVSRDNLQPSTPSSSTTAHFIIAKLLDTNLSVSEKRSAVLQAEVIPFQADDRNTIIKILREFIDSNKNSNVGQDLIAVASAIRKMVSYLDIQNIGELADLLGTNDRVSIPLETELEITKTIARKLIANPPVIDNSEPILADKLFDIVDVYLRPRLISREKYGAVTINAIMSLVILRSTHCNTVSEKVVQCSADWFTQLLCRRINRLIVEKKPLQPNDMWERFSTHLVNFVSNISH